MTTNETSPLGSECNAELGPEPEARQCQECHGKGWNDVWKKVAGHHMGGEVFREDCDRCEGTGKA